MGEFTGYQNNEIIDKYVSILEYKAYLNEGIVGNMIGKFFAKRMLKSMSKENFSHFLISAIDNVAHKELGYSNPKYKEIVKQARNLFQRSKYAKLSDKEAPKVAAKDFNTIFELIQKAKKESGLKEGKGDGAEYKAFFNKMLKKFGVTSPSQLKGAEKKKFFKAIEDGWTKEDPKTNDKDRKE